MPRSWVSLVRARDRRLAVRRAQSARSGLSAACAAAGRGAVVRRSAWAAWRRRRASVISKRKPSEMVPQAMPVSPPAPMGRGSRSVSGVRRRRFRCRRADMPNEMLRKRALKRRRRAAWRATRRKRSEGARDPAAIVQTGPGLPDWQFQSLAAQLVRARRARSPLRARDPVAVHESTARCACGCC